MFLAYANSSFLFFFFTFLPLTLIFRDFVVKRRPCIITGHLPECHFDRWTNSLELKRRAGHAVVQVSDPPSYPNL